MKARFRPRSYGPSGTCEPGWVRCASNSTVIASNQEVTCVPQGSLCPISRVRILTSNDPSSNCTYVNSSTSVFPTPYFYCIDRDGLILPVYDISYFEIFYFSVTTSISRNAPCFPGNDGSVLLDVRASPSGTCSLTDSRWNYVDTNEVEKNVFLDNGVNKNYTNIFGSTSTIYAFASRSEISWSQFCPVSRENVILSLDTVDTVFYCTIAILALTIVSFILLSCVMAGLEFYAIKESILYYKFSFFNFSTNSCNKKS